MPPLEPRERRQASSTVHDDCPQCRGHMAVMRVIGGCEFEYWTMRCTRCGGIHLDIVKESGS